MVYDLVMLSLIIYTTARGASKGMAWQLAAIASLVLCFLFATPLSLSLAPYIAVHPPLNRWIAMLAIYLVFSFGCFSVARMLRGLLEQVRFEEYDRHLGALFGFVKGAMICFVLTFFTVCLSEQACAYVLRTNSGYLSAVAMRELELIMPAELESVLQQYEHRLDQPGPSMLSDLAQREGIGLLGTQQPDGDPAFRGSYRTVDPGVTGNGNATPPQGYNLNPNEHGPLVADWLHRIPNLFSGGMRSRVEGLLRSALPDGQPDTSVLDPRAGSQPQYPTSQSPTTQYPTSQYPTTPYTGQTPPGPSQPQFRQPVPPPLPAGVRPPVRDQSLYQDSEPGFTMPVNPGAVPPLNRGPVAQAPQTPDQLFNERVRLEDEIAGLFTRDPQKRRAMDREIDDTLLDIPDVVAIAALQDWLSDLTGQGGDPDPQTDVTTDLNVRIARQLQAFGIRLSQLPQSVEDRLRGQAPR